jgi:UDP:flavonoid glycosyltransferase YjiC (YdhE family)
MANILLTWELGGGRGHLYSLLPLARGLADAGHSVFLAFRDLSRAHRVYAGVEAQFLQAPFRAKRGVSPIEPARSFAHLLHNTGFDDAPDLAARVKAWRSLYEQVRPALIVFEHSPTALLAARGMPAKRAVVGVGFACPTDEYPLRDLQTWLPGEPDKIRRDEDRVLANANRALAGWGQPPLDRLAELYADVDATLVCTFAELDPYATRRETEYYGVCSETRGKAPAWPDAAGKRVFAYLKPFPGLAKVLAALERLGCSTLVVGDRLSADLQERFRPKNVRFEQDAVDLVQAAKICDLAVLNGGHGTTATMLLAGKPILQIPLVLEQVLNSRAVARLGAGAALPVARLDQIPQQFHRLFSSNTFGGAAARFSDKYARVDRQTRATRLLDRILRML